MAITKLSYTRQKSGARASLDYYTHRPNREGEKQTRDLFGRDGALSKRQGYLMIDRADWNTVFLRIALSPDPNLEDSQKDLNLGELAEQTIARLQRHLQQTHIQYIATEHTDQTEIRHVHIIALVNGRSLSTGQLSLRELDRLKEGATADAVAMREALDDARGVTRARSAPQQAPSPSRQNAEPQQAAATATKPRQAKPTGLTRTAALNRPDRVHGSFGSTRQPVPTCPNCGLYAEMVRRGRFCIRRGWPSGLNCDR